MKLTVVYNYPVFGGDHDDFAMRFAMSYTQFPPGEDHNTLVISNGGEPTSKMRNIIECMGDFPNLHWFRRENTAKDIGGYQDVARGSASDLLVFFGGSTFFWKAGWLNRVVESYCKYGDSLYGTMGNSGDKSVNVWPHIRTTGFWISPRLFNRYPLKATSDEERYQLEHGKTCLTMWAVRLRLKPKIVTWDNEYDVNSWKNVPNSFHRGNQSGLLFKDRLAEAPYYTL